MKKLNVFRAAAVAVAAAALGVSNVAMATGPDFSGMTSQIDWSTVTAAILLVAGGLSAIYVIFTGSSLINSKIRGGK